MGLGPFAKAAEEGQGLAAGSGHAIPKHEIGEIRIAEQAGFLAAQLEDARDQRAVVEGAGDGPCDEGAIDLFADRGIVEIRHQRRVARRLQRKSPAGGALPCGALARRLDRALRQARQPGLLRDDQFERVGGVEHVLGELRGGGAQLNVDRGQPRLARGVELCAVAAEIVERFGEETEPRALEPACLVRGGITLQRLPQPLVERNAGVEPAHLGLDRIHGRAQIGGGGDRLKMLHDGHGAVERLGQFVERLHRVLEIRRGCGCGEPSEAFARILEQRRDGRLDVDGLDTVKRDGGFQMQQRVLHASSRVTRARAQTAAAVAPIRARPGA